MGSNEHEKIVKRGVDAILQWRTDNPRSVMDLRGADLAGLKLNGARLDGADLTGARLCGAQLMGARLNEATLVRAQLRGTKLSKAELNRADLTGAEGGPDGGGADTLFVLAKLRGATLRYAKLRSTDFTDADLSHADLHRADLSTARLGRADLSGADLSGANLSDANVFDVRYDRGRLRCRGVRAATCFGNPLFKRDAMDADWIETFVLAHPVLGWLWRVTTDYGRSFGLLLAWAFGVALLFGLMYSGCPGAVELPRERAIESGPYDSCFSPFYFSVVTLTTLGFGDITPRSWYGEVMVTIEVILGYGILGLLVSMLANKVARRS